MTNQNNLDVIAEKVRVLEREIQELKQEVRRTMDEVDDIDKSNIKIVQELKGVTGVISEVKEMVTNLQTTISKENGWRGFFLDVIKALAQIAALILAGRWIF